MGRKPTAPFDAKVFLTKASTGRSVSVYRRKPWGNRSGVITRWMG